MVCIRRVPGSCCTDMLRTMADKQETTYPNGQPVPQPPHVSGAGQPLDTPTPAAPSVPQPPSATPPVQGSGVSTVNLQPAPQPESSQTYVPAMGDEEYSHPGWSWGGFFWGLPFLIAIRKYRYMLLLAAPFLVLFGVVTLWGISALVAEMNGAPGVNTAFAIVVPIAIAISVLFFFVLPFYFGFKGRMLAATSGTFSNKEQYVGFMKAFDHGAMIAFFLMIASWVVLIVFGVLFGVLVGVADIDTSAAALNAIDRMQGYFK